MSHTEKSTVSNDDGLPPDVAALLEEFSGPKYDKLMRKMDLHLIPIVSFPKLHRRVSFRRLGNANIHLSQIAVLYLLAYLDR